MKFATRERKDGKAMANHEQDGIGSEEELFSEMLSSDAPKFGGAEDLGNTGAEPAALEPEKPSRERDDLGRFRAKSQDAQEQPAVAEPPKQEVPAQAAAQDPAATQQPPAKEDDAHGNIPSWRMREIREARDAERARREEAERRAATYETHLQQSQRAIADLQKQLQQIQNPPKQPDPINLFDDQGPERFVGSIDERLAAQERAFQQQIRNVRLETNFAMTHQLNPDVFPAAFQAFEQAINSGDRVVGARVFNSPNPGSALVAWHKEQSAIKEIGGDVASYRQRIIEEAKKDPAILAQFLEAARAQAIGQSAPAGQPAARPNTVTQLPPSLRSVPGSSASADSTGLERMSEEELFNSTAR